MRFFLSFGCALTILLVATTFHRPSYRDHDNYAKSREFEQDCKLFREHLELEYAWAEVRARDHNFRKAHTTDPNVLDTYRRDVLKIIKQTERVPKLKKAARQARKAFQAGTNPIGVDTSNALGHMAYALNQNRTRIEVRFMKRAANPAICDMSPPAP